MLACFGSVLCCLVSLARPLFSALSNAPQRWGIIVFAALRCVFQRRLEKRWHNERQQFITARRVFLCLFNPSGFQSLIQISSTQRPRLVPLENPLGRSVQSSAATMQPTVQPLTKPWGSMKQITSSQCQLGHWFPNGGRRQKLLTNKIITFDTPAQPKERQGGDCEASTPQSLYLPERQMPNMTCARVDTDSDSLWLKRDGSQKVLGINNSPATRYPSEPPNTTSCASASSILLSQKSGD